MRFSLNSLAGCALLVGACLLSRTAAGEANFTENISNYYSDILPWMVKDELKVTFYQSISVDKSLGQCFIVPCFIVKQFKGQKSFSFTIWPTVLSFLKRSSHSDSGKCEREKLTSS